MPLPGIKPETLQSQSTDWGSIYWVKLQSHPCWGGTKFPGFMLPNLYIELCFPNSYTNISSGIMMHVTLIFLFFFCVFCLVLQYAYKFCTSWTNITLPLIRSMFPLLAMHAIANQTIYLIPTFKSHLNHHCLGFP